MKILYIVQHFSGPSGNSGSRPFENATRLAGMGHEVTVLCGTYDRMAQEDVAAAEALGVRMHVSPVWYGQGMSYIARLLAFRRFMRWAVRRGCSLPRPDVVFASSTPLTIGEVGRVVSAHHKCKFVFEVRDLWPEIPIVMGALRNPVLRLAAGRMARRVYRAADRVVALSTGMKAGVLAWGVPSDRVDVISNCSDTESFGGAAHRDYVRAERTWQDLFVCVHPGAMGRINGLDYLLDAARVLDRRMRNDILIAIIGDGVEKQHLESRIAGESIHSAKIYESIRKSDMPDLLSAADAGIVTVARLPGLEANSANKFFDFLAAGLPVLVNYGGWQAEALQSSGAGLAVDPSDPATLADALIAFRDDPERCRQMGLNARKLAEDQYDRAKLVGQLDAVLRLAAGLPCPEEALSV
ncbi:MAG TPA: glycosyltransferase family 4 protein [Armatimonadota bacterium]|jgi:glycosyltransferase involved in cell wall biosynthesis